MRVAVIGCTHAGTAAIKTMQERYNDVEIDVFERNDTVSFLSCGIALHVGGVVKNAEDLFYASVEGFEEMGVRMHMKHDVESIDTKAHTLSAKNLDTGETQSYNYDKLVLTMGSWPIVPKLPNSDLENIMLCKNYDHAKEIVKRTPDAKHVTVVGAGYIGVELVEAFEESGKEVTLIDATPQILPRYFDKSFIEPVETSFADKGVQLLFNETVERFEGDGKVEKVVTNKSTVESDLVIMCIGFRPNTGLVGDQIERLPNGAIVIDEYMHTSESDVFAAGDCCAVPYNPTGHPAYIPLATNAVRMGTLVGENLKKPVLRHPGAQGTSGLKIYSHHLASTGLTKHMAEANDMDVQVSTINDYYRPEFMPENHSILLNLVYETQTGRVVGAQMLSDIDLTQVVNTVSIAIAKKMTIEELALADAFFQPHFNKPVHYLNAAALQALHTTEPIDEDAVVEFSGNLS